MAAKIHIFETALDDLQDALDYYESQSQGLEQRFSKAVNERIQFVANHPEASPVRAENFRGAQLKKLPYTIYYDFDEHNNCISISAVLHDKRARKILKERL
jgi:plasmid stabilization system protein ParE